MGDTTTRYVPHDYRRICDVCGQLRNRSQLVERAGSEFVCSYHPRERTQLELSNAIAATRPIHIKPVPNPKPLDPNNPNTFEADEMVLFNFIDQQIQAGTRYETVVSGDGAPLTGHVVETMAWAARYLYNLIIENKRPLRIIARATTLLSQAATTLRTRQQGFGISTSSTRTNDTFYGGVLESGATTWVTEDTATAGLAFLYAYRLSGSTVFRDSAEAAASYLRNVQAIGSNGTNFTSSDAAGTGRLYTGAVASQVSTASGFYSNHAFYLGDLLTLQFWHALQSTVGDIDVGTAGTPTGFTTAATQLLSESIADMREFWETGVLDADGDTVTGLSSTTPKEFFNAYPESKPHFGAGTGLWEYQDGDATDGTLVTGMNFAKGLHALYAYEGASTQVTTVSDWLRTFTSNSDFETAANTSDMALARATTGTYDPTISLATLLLVRDPDDDFADTKQNGSSLYDWGAFGLMAPIWATRNKASFTTGRIAAIGIAQRYRDATRSDGDMFDRITLRGESGLTYQTAFSVNLTGYDAGSTPYAAGSTSVTTPPLTGLVWWLKGDVGLESSGGLATAWRDQSGTGQDLDSYDPGFQPTTGVDTINGIPCLTFPITASAATYLKRATTLQASDGKLFGYDGVEHEARTIMAVIKPRFSPLNFNITGGPVLSMASSPRFQCVFDLEDNFAANAFYCWSSSWRDPNTPNPLKGPDTVGGSGGTYDNVALVAEWRSPSYPTISFSINGFNIPLTPSVMYGATGPPGSSGVMLGNIAPVGGGLNFLGAIAEVLLWDYELTGDALAQARAYISARYSGTVATVELGTVNDAVRAAQFANAFRFQPVAVEMQA